MLVVPRGPLTVAAAAVMFLATVAPAAAAPRPVLDLELNDARGAQTAVDTSGAGHDALIGSHVVMNGAEATFDVHRPDEGIPYQDEHLVLVPDASDGSLDPGRGNFSVEVRFRYTATGGGPAETPNLLQKGQAGARGGQVKLQFSGGRIECTFKTPQGTATTTSATSVTDGSWHVVRCERTPTSLTVSVDGVRSAVQYSSTGTLDNTKPWALGGKQQCDARQVDCDYFAGAVDYVRLTKG